VDRVVNEVNAEQARRWVTQQLEALQQLRHAAFRDTAFKQWRSDTHKMAQQIWPAQPGRAERFRRIPYAAPMARPTDREIRDWYERGCAEARALLRLWLAEIKVLGIPEAQASSNGEAFRSPGTRGKPRLKDMLGLTGLEPSQPDSTEGSATDASPPAESSRPDENSPPAASREQAGDVLRSIIESAVERARDEMRAIHETADRQNDEEHRPGFESPGSQPSDGSPALMVAWLAVEIESLDIPPEHIERVRGELIGLARHLEGGEIEWSVVQDAIRAVLPYPSLARRLLPLITPRLEDAA